MVGAIEIQELAVSNVLCPEPRERERERERENQCSPISPEEILAVESDICGLIGKLFYYYSSCS